jgi:hypothetical protein
LDLLDRLVAPERFQGLCRLITLPVVTQAVVQGQMAVTHALTMRSFGNLNRSNEIQQRDSNALTVARLTKAFAWQVDALAKTSDSCCPLT